MVMSTRVWQILMAEARSRRGRLIALAMFLVVVAVDLVLGGIKLWWVLADFIAPADATGRKDLVQTFGLIVAGGVGLIGAVVGLGGLYISRKNLQTTQSSLRQQREIEDERAQQQQRIEDQRAQDTALQAFYEQIGDLLTEHDLRRTDRTDIPVLARAQTLTVLRRLDSRGKGHLLSFLYGAGLITPGEFTGEAIISLNEADLRGTYLRGAYLKDADLREADLRGADIREARLDGALLGEADLTEAQLNWADLRNTDLIWTSLRHAALGRAILFKADLRRADLRETDLTVANLSEAILRSADLREADLTEAILTEADLREVVLGHAILSGAVLAKAVLRGANLNGAVLREAVLKGADLSGAVLNGAVLIGADLTEVNFSDADLTAANLRHATGTTEEQLAQALSLERATLPTG